MSSVYADACCSEAFEQGCRCIWGQALLSYDVKSAATGLCLFLFVWTTLRGEKSVVGCWQFCPGRLMLEWGFFKTTN